MTRGDQFKPLDGSNMADKTKLAGDAALDAFFEELKETGPRSNYKPSTPISDIGPIRQIILPGMWAEDTTERNQMGTSFFKSFHPASGEDVKFSFYYRGMRSNPLSGKAFLDVLSHPPHQLSGEEINSLGQTVRNKDSETFSLSGAHTEAINGRNVLIVEGSYYKDKPNQVDTRVAYIDSDGTGTAVQEIHYHAEKKNYPLHLKEATDSLRSINWK